MEMKLLEKEVLDFVKKKHPEAFEEFDIAIKPLEVPDINDTNIANLTQAIYLIFLSQRIDSCTLLYNLVYNFAKTFKEKEQMVFLNKIWAGTEKNMLPVTILELILARDLSNIGFKVTQNYNYAFGQIYTLGDLNILLQYAKKRIMGVFFEVYLKHNVKVIFQMPQFSSQQPDGMPSL
jgi:hypothetical protein